MSKALITESILDDIAVAIKNKLNIPGTIKPVNMASEILRIPSENHFPVHLGITQSDNQTISATYSLNYGASSTQSFTITLPQSVTVNATVTPASGYDAGELNKTIETVSWGESVSFSATPAQKAKTRLTIVQPFGGTITVNNQEGTYFEFEDGETITIKTVTEDGFDFEGWEGI